MSPACYNIAVNRNTAFMGRKMLPLFCKAKILSCRHNRFWKCYGSCACAFFELHALLNIFLHFVLFLHYAFFPSLGLCITVFSFSGYAFQPCGWICHNWTKSSGVDIWWLPQGEVGFDAYSCCLSHTYFYLFFFHLQIIFVPFIKY